MTPDRSWELALIGGALLAVAVLGLLGWWTW